MSDPLEPRELGTLIVVVGKARNLPNKSRFGKQDPFCSVRVGDDKKKTKPIKRGGQHPEWDEELRFTIMEDLEEVLARSESTSALNASTSSQSSLPAVPSKDPSQQGVTTAAALASKSRKGPLGKDKAGKKMIITCYADDAKEPDLIGECVVPIDEVLKKGEVDEWYEFLYKEKYAGEVYLELTFYSNDAPPVKRNPSIQKYGQSSVLTPAASAASLSSRPSMQSLATSSSVAGMNLYIPPYIQPAQALQAPPATHNQGHMQGSSSFANLGVPQHQGGPHGHVQSYGHMPSAASTSTLHVHDPMDALTRPMSSMSISSAATGQPSRPLPPTAPQHSVPPAHPSGAHMPQPGQHRHSLGEAPWANLLPQNQPVMPSYTPVSRPVSAAESYGQSAWDHARFAASTPLARPASQAYNPSHNVPIANGGAYPPQQPAVPHHRHAHSFSGLSAAEPHPSTYLKPAMPQPPIPPASAPPAPYVPPIPEQDWQHNHSQNYQQGQTSYTSSSSHYPLPSSSFPTLNASHSQTPDPYRATTPTPSTYGPTDPYDPRAATPLPAVPYNQYDQMQNQGQYGTSDPYRATTPTPGNYQQQQPQPPYHPPPQSANPLNTSTSSSHYYPADPTPPRRQSTPSMSQQNQGYQPTPPSQPNAQGYVPWFQQTRPGSTATPPPPPVPDYTRPVPAPPAPPKGGAGYYPSDELYVQQQHQPPQQQPSPYGWQAPGQPPSLPSTGSALENAIGQRAPYGWQSTVGEPSRQPSPAPAAYGQTHDYQQHQQQGYQAPYADANTSSSSVSTGYHAAANGVTAAPGTSAMKQDWKSYMASLGSSGSFPARSPSPLPPVPPPPAQGQGDWYTPPPAVPSSIRPQDGWNGSGQCNQ